MIKKIILLGLIISNGFLLSSGDLRLIEAIKNNNLDLAKELIEKHEVNKIDLNAKDVYGETALIRACRYAYIEIAQMLIDFGANLNIQNRYGDTALMLACWDGHIEIAKMLINAGANLNIQYNYGK